VYRVLLNKYRATWTYVTKNPQGGSFGSNHCGPRYVALAKARRGIPLGSKYELIVNERSLGMFERGAAGEIR